MHIHCQELMDALSGAKWFNTLDLLNGYWQVEVEREDQPKTAFCTTEGLFEFKVMSFGLYNAPATFQCLMDVVLARLKGSHCLVYLDDIIILGMTFKQHLLNLNSVFERICESGLKIKISKCSFLRSEVHYLGHIISRNGITPDPSNTKWYHPWSK